jgi:hypothetical protein
MKSPTDIITYCDTALKYEENPRNIAFLNLVRAYMVEIVDHKRTQAQRAADMDKALGTH